MNKPLLITLLFLGALANVFTLIVGDLFQQFIAQIGMAPWLFTAWMVLVGLLAAGEILVAIVLLRGEQPVERGKNEPTLQESLEKQKYLIEREFRSAQRDEPEQKPQVVVQKPRPPMPTKEELARIKITDEEEKDNPYEED